MENGSFQYSFRNSMEVDFQEKLPPTPDQASGPSAIQPNSHKTSSTVEALISQNEDLMSRLKVTLRRLTQVESQLELSEERLKKTQFTNASIEDEILIWKEKETFWLKKNQTLESQMNEIRARFPELDQMQDKLERYQKYHEKVRTQVKPYIQQLKSYAQNLTIEVQTLTSELHKKDACLTVERRRFQELTQDVEELHHQHDRKLAEMIEMFESEKALLVQEQQSLNRLNSNLEIRSQKLDESLLRNDELENTIIALKRLKDQTDQDQKNQAQVTQKENEALRKEVLELSLSLDEVKRNSAGTREEADRQKSRADLLQEQLSSLRFLWTKKCQDTEKLEATLQSLEKLNQDLSSRLNQMRKGAATL